MYFCSENYIQCLSWLLQQKYHRPGCLQETFIIVLEAGKSKIKDVGIFGIW